MAKWPQRNPLRLLFQWRGWKSTLSASFITFSEREPFFRGFLWWNSCNYWSQRCIGVSEQCETSCRSFWRNLAISEEISWAYSFKFASSSPSVSKSCHFLHRERKSQNLIGYCPRKVYWNILHCKLWWISRNALTHVKETESVLIKKKIYIYKHNTTTYLLQCFNISVAMSQMLCIFLSYN